MYALMYPILYIASIHCYIPLSTATSISMCSVCIVLWHDHVNGEIKALKKKKKIAISAVKPYHSTLNNSWSTMWSHSIALNFPIKNHRIFLWGQSYLCVHIYSALCKIVIKSTELEQDLGPLLLTRFNFIPSMYTAHKKFMNGFA